MLSWWTWTWWETIVVVLLAIIAFNTLFTGTVENVLEKCGILIKGPLYLCLFLAVIVGIYTRFLS